MRWTSWGLLGLVATACEPVAADEGLWRPMQLPAIADRIRTLGLTADPLADPVSGPLAAVVDLGGCSGAVVSTSGLILTNHHCAYGTLQHLSGPDADRLAEGFLASDPSLELRAAPGFRLNLTTETRDVTALVLSAAGHLHGLERQAAIAGVEKSLVADCESDPGHRCRVRHYLGGSEFELVKSLEIRDLRLVYAPPRAIGRFGGDVDNWSWPRHTADLALFRVYVAPSGSSGPPADGNVPWTPPSSLPVAREGISEGEAVLVAGYPGTTSRHRLSLEVEDAIAWFYPQRIAVMEAVLEALGSARESDPDLRLKYASQAASLGNALKRDRGVLQGLIRLDLAARKRAGEEALRDWMAGDQTRSGEYLDDLEALERDIVQARATRDRDFQYRWLRRLAQLPRAAMTLYRLARERDRPDAEREPGYQDRDRTRIEARLRRLDQRMDPQVDQALMNDAIGRYARLPASRRITAFDQAFGLLGEDPDLSGVALRVKALYDGTRLADANERLAWLDRPASAFDASDDPLIQLAVSLYETDLALEAEAKEREGRRQRLRASVMQAMGAFARDRGEVIYADGNGSLRLGFGRVRGYRPRDGVDFAAFTSLRGVAEKHTGVWPFDATEAQMAAIADLGEAAGRIPVNFLAEVDIAGGSSGSPVINAGGELVGLVFDGNSEGLVSDWVYDPTQARSIQVDVRYLIWLLELAGASDLLVEMGVRPPG